MPIEFSQAKDIAAQELLSAGWDIAVGILDRNTKEFDEGWIFYYQSSRFIETGEFEHSLVGNTPLFVARSNGQTFFVPPHHRPLAESMAAYRACGNPNGQQLPEVRLTGWSAGALAVSAIQVIRKYSTLGLGEAKTIVENCLANQLPVVPVSSIEEAKTLVAALEPTGFHAEVRYGG